MEIQEIKDLLSQFDTSSLTEFDLKQGDFELYFNKNEMSRGTAAAAPQATPGTTPAPQAAPVILDNESRGDAPAPAHAAAPAVGTEITSPLVGVVYLKPAPDKPNFKNVGDQVKVGDVLCIVEAMKVMNEITADVTGEIVAINVENEQIVEFNQTLFTVKEG